MEKNEAGGGGDDGTSMDAFDLSKIKSTLPPAGYRQCSLEPKQVEEIFLKAHHYERLALVEWCRSNQNAASSEQMVLLLPQEKDSGVEGKPERWQIETVDTGRFASFRFKKIIFTSVPPRASDTDLFATGEFSSRRSASTSLVSFRCPS